MPKSVRFICHNSAMDKLAYHYNKKKKPAKTAGKFLYYISFAYLPCPENKQAFLRGEFFHASNSAVIFLS